MTFVQDLDVLTKASMLGVSLILDTTSFDYQYNNKIICMRIYYFQGYHKVVL